MDIKYDLVKRKECLSNNNYKTKFSLKESYMRDNIPMDNIIQFIRERQVDSIYRFNECLSIASNYISNKGTTGSNKIITALKENITYQTAILDTQNSIEDFVSRHNIGHSLLEDCEVYRTCDRMTRNYESLSKITNIDKVLKENQYDIVEGILELCNIINNLNIDLEVKYNMTLESVLYVAIKNHIDINEDTLLETVTDYYTCNQSIQESSINYILNSSVVFNEASKNKIKTRKDNIKGSAKEIVAKLKQCKFDDKAMIKSLIYKLYTKSPENIIEETPNFLSFFRGAIVFGSLAAGPIGLIPIFVDQFIAMSLKRKHTIEMLAKFKSEKKTIENKIASCKKQETKEKYEKYLETIEKSIEKIEIYRDSLHTDEEVYELDENARMVFELQNSISIEDYFDKYHNDFKNEIPRVLQMMFNEVKSKYRYMIECDVLQLVDSEVITNFSNLTSDTVKGYINSIDNNVYIDLAYLLPLNSNILETELVDQVSKICDYLNFRTQSKYIIYYEGDGDMYHLHMGLSYPIDRTEFDRSVELDKEVLESCVILKMIEENISKLPSTTKLQTLIESNVTSDLTLETGKSLIEFSNYVNVLNPTTLQELLKETSDNMYKVNQDAKTYMNAHYINKLSRDMKLENTIEYPNNRYNAAHSLFFVNEFVNTLETGILQETSFGNNLKIAKENLKRNTKKLSDKDKIISNQLDNALDKMYDKVQKELTTKNRTAVIKGSIIPSFSSIIKLVLASGAVSFLISPALAAITVIAGIAISKQGTNKERQFILDEIDIQIKMTEKKIQLAEQNNDLDAVENLMKIEKKLKRERQRIHYKIRAYVPVSKD